MRISTRQLFDTGVRNIQRSQEQLVRLQEQLSTGRRLLTPADDPVATARALTVSQAKEINHQYASNQSEASDRLRLVDSQLSAVNDLLQSVRTRAVQAGNTVLADSDRQAIATELAARFDELLGLANGRNAQGDYLFGGYRSEVPPFSLAAAVAPATTPSISYHGDDGQQLLQVGAAEMMAANVSGNELFMRIPEGNATFSTSAGRSASASPNLGSGVIDSGAVVDPTSWRNALNDFPWQGSSNHGLEIRFSVVAGVAQYQLFDISTNPGLSMPPLAVSNLQPFTPGLAIPLATSAPPAAAAVDFGSHVVISGSPADGDAFQVRPSVNKSVFQTMQEVIDLLRVPLSSAAARTDFSGKMSSHLTNLDQALANVNRVQASVGARMQELDSLSATASAVDIQYRQTLSELQDLDYAQAISDFSKQQVALEAAQKSFVEITRLSLFQYL